MVMLMLKWFKVNGNKIIYLFGLGIIYLLCFIFFLNSKLNGVNCCSKYPVKGQYDLLCYCVEPKFKSLFNLADFLEHDCSNVIFIFLILFLVYSVYYLIKTRKKKRKIISKILIIISFLFIFYLLILCLGDFIMYV